MRVCFSGEAVKEAPVFRAARGAFAHPLRIEIQSPYQADQRTLLWTSKRRASPPGFDGTVPGRMYSGVVFSRDCLTMRVPDWYPNQPRPLLAR